MIFCTDDLDAFENRYLAAVAHCFADWGGAEMYDWCFRRSAGFGPADLLLAEESGRLVAASGVTYRLARRSAGASVEPIACMTASWTIPAARGRGIFRQMVEMSRQRAVARGCRLLIAFAADENASARVLAAAGAHKVPAVYLKRTRPRRSGQRAPLEQALTSFANRRLAHEDSRIEYPEDAWRGQMAERPRPVYALSLASGGYAIVESSPGGERLLDVSVADPRSLAETAACVDLAWSANPAQTAVLAAAGFSSTPGGLFLLSPDQGAAACWQRWSIANGERM